MLRLQHVDAPEGFVDLDYDAAGNLVSYTDSGGRVTYTYNAADQLVALAEPGGDCTGYSIEDPPPAAAACTVFAVDDDGRRTTTRYPSGATQATTLDAAGRPQRIVGTTGGATRVDLGYDYTDPTVPADPANPDDDTMLITSVSDAVADAATGYSYDGLDRLTVADTTPVGGGPSTAFEAFCYDAAGNRTGYHTTPGSTCASPQPTIAAGYDAANALVTATGPGVQAGPGFGYDGNGNETAADSATARTTTWGDRDQATTITPTGGSPIGYDYAGAGNLERTNAGSTTFQPSPLTPAPAWSTTAGTGTWTVRDPDGALIAIRRGTTPAAATSHYPLTDHQGSVRVLTNPDGTVANTYTYTAYGITTATETVPNPYRYTGAHQDTATGLYKLGTRYYDPTHGRFTQPDPTGQEQHPYLYAAANPCNTTDPTGALTCRQSVFMAVVGAGLLATSAATFFPLAASATAGAAATVGVADTIGFIGAQFGAALSIGQAVEGCT